jgi:hypothetical protein
MFLAVGIAWHRFKGIDHDMRCYVKHVALCGCLSVALECGENNNGGKWSRIEVCYLSQCLQLSPLKLIDKISALAGCALVCLLR